MTRIPADPPNAVQVVPEDERYLLDYCKRCPMPDRLDFYTPIRTEVLTPPLHQSKAGSITQATYRCDNGHRWTRGHAGPEPEQRSVTDLVTLANAERSLIGRLMLGARRAALVFQILDSDALVDEGHRCIYELLYGMFRHSEPIDVTSVEAALHASGKLDQAGGTATLHSMTVAADACPESKVLSMACAIAERQIQESPLPESKSVEAPQPASQPTASLIEPDEDDVIASLLAVCDAARAETTPSHLHQVNTAVAISAAVEAMAKVAHPDEYGAGRESMYEVVKYMATIAGAMTLFLDRWADICGERSDMYVRPERSTLNPLTADFPADLLDGRRKATKAEAQQLANTDAQEIRAIADAYRHVSEVARTHLPATGFLPPDTTLEIPTALYLWYDADDRLLYIGITGDLAVRQTSHAKRSSWGEFAVKSEVRRHPTRQLALSAEAELIRDLQPLFNRQHNDTPEARARLVAYLVEKDRLDLLAPAVSRG